MFSEVVLGVKSLSTTGVIQTDGHFICNSNMYILNLGLNIF